MYLNRSRDVSGNAHTFRTLGLFASGGGSTLTVASNNQTFSSGSLTASTTINGNINNPTITITSEFKFLLKKVDILQEQFLVTVK